MLLWIMNLLTIIVTILLSIAFVTLMERQYIGISQRRLGPNKVSIMGLMQPILDGLKLMLKSTKKTNKLNPIFYLLMPIMNLTLLTLFWWGFPLLYNPISFQVNLLFTITLMGIMSFGIVLSGWVSNSKYATYGSLRSMSQSISYEVCLSTTLLMIMMLKDSYNLATTKTGFYHFELMITLALTIPATIMILAETNRSPFDLAEAESELVSGFNIEFSSVEFAFLFMAEYGMIILLSILFSILLLPWCSPLLTLLLISSIIMSRSTFPRIRYDTLMSLMWKSLLPVMISMLIPNLNMKVL
uniref:NADH-ubiquinone oxidoreductase chain 1 n=1 Tax=Trichinella murrelli TaxID=144512 RepID=I3W947_9BILA|nr:NADH dehydrogenase subunit 1 [Trichinella murrelli]AFK93093.1 NADH dehydrogenase subunit 1 [Trichinella murrelli]AIW56982.1 NADH dehydrogenase subunit 1 [Trichinella murrelli]